MAKLVDFGTQVLKNARPHLEHFWYYAKVELAPPKITDIPKIASGVTKVLSSAKSGAWKNLTVKQAVINTLVGAEVVGWFFIGECIGKRHLIGYKLN